MAGEKTGDCGMRSRRSCVGVRPLTLRGRSGRRNGEGGTRGADVVLRASQWQEHVLLALIGCDIGVKGVSLPERSEKKPLWALCAVEGLEMAGDKALRKSV